MFQHKTVLLRETVDGLNIKPDGTYVDCTLGGAGHSTYLLQQLSEKGRLIAFDQDDTALQHAKEVLSDYKGQLILIKSNFRYLKEYLNEQGVTEVDGILFDLGVSSPQLDTPERGFSYHHDAPLDMRMDQSATLSAKEVVNEWRYEDLVRIFFKYGEEKFSKQIARKIEEARMKSPIQTTGQLVDLIKDAIPAPARRSGGHPAKRVFQAIRIAVNDELRVFEEASLEPLLLKNAAFIQDQLQFLERTVMKRIEEKEGYVLKDYERIQNSIKPLLAPQERIWNIMYYLNRYGPKFFTTFKNLPFSFQNQHQVVKL